MKTLYQSSRFQTYFYLFIYPLLICISLFFIFGIINYGNYGIFNILIVLILIYALIAASETIINLKYIRVTEDGIYSKVFGQEEKIEFRNVFYAYNLINQKGVHLIIWYKDINSNKLKVIYTRPERDIKSFKISFKEMISNNGKLEITKYIIEKAKRDNPGYLDINNERWFLWSISPTFKIF